MPELSWTDAQLQKIDDAVAEAFGKASVATAFLNPCYGPLGGGAETVRNERLVQREDTVRLEVNHDSLNLRLVNLLVHVDLSSEQVADETMSNALLAFRRAANILAQEEDRIVFDGYGRGGVDSIFVSNHPRPQKGLADPLQRLAFTPIKNDGPSVVPAVVGAISQLEDQSNPGPFACILGNELFKAVHTPDDSLVLPADRITPIVNGPLLRAGTMNPYSGIVVSLAAKAVDIVVGTPPTVQFLTRTHEGRFLFRVYERFVMRLRDTEHPPVAGFTVPNVASAAQGVAGAELKIATHEEALARAFEVQSTAADNVVKAIKSENNP